MGKRFPLSFLEMLRGYFFESFSEREFKEIVEPLVGYKVEFCQDNDSLSEASTFIEVLEKRQGLKVACLEDICFLYWMKEVDLHTHLIWLMPLSPYWIR